MLILRFLLSPIPSFCLASLLLATLPSPPARAAEATPPEAESEMKPVPSVPTEREETLRNQAVAALLATTDPATERNWLGSGKNRFLGLYLPDHSGTPFANALILHDNLQNPDWPGVVRDLRHELAAAGWNTFSIAVPDYRPVQDIPPLQQAGADAARELDTEATEPPGMGKEPDATAAMEIKAEEVPQQLAQRIRAASQYMSEKSPLPVVIIAQGSSATLVAKQAQELFLQDINGLVIIDPTPLPQLKGFDEALDVMDLRVPVLDIAPEFNARSDPAIRRQNARRLQHGQYQQRILRGSSGDFIGAEPRLVKAIRGWGETLFKR